MPEDHGSTADNDRPAGLDHHGPWQKVRDLVSSRTDSRTDTVTEDHLLSILAARRGREETFGRELFADPAWDLLLELYAAELGARLMLFPDLVRSLDMPASTTARWICVLVQRRWLTWCGGDDDPIELSREGASAMKRLMDHWTTAFRSI